MGRRRTQRADDTVRQLLLADHYKRCATNPGSRWYPHGYVCDYCRDLAAGEQIVVSSSGLMCALVHAGLPTVDDYAFGGRHWGKKFLLDEDGTLSEWTGPEDD